MTILDNETVDLPTPRGNMRTSILRPAAPGKYPGIVLWSEIFQITAPVRRAAAVLAGHGFVVAIPEIWHELEPPGCVLAYDQAGADKGNAHKTGKELASYDDDARAVIDCLLAHPHCTGRLGTMGICIGGHLATRTAFHPEIRAAVCFYATDIHKRSLAKGMNDDTLDRLGEMKGEMLYIWGKQDPHIPREGRRIVYDALTDAGVNFTWHEFNGQHAFMRDEGPRYDPALQLQCYGLALDLFRRKLHEGDLSAAEAEGPAESRH
ncbi:MAG TPA: dienelactone hydrolase family protein [Verrucomicrobiales bacterium]|jgi:carboxymethylenebutenolidase|nr:dienelactone hydrolase family protein [Verrucomicrobiales bacterium]